MRRGLVVALLSFEAVVFCAILACSLQLSRDVTRSGTAQRLAHAVVHTTRQLAARLTHAPLG
jgi:hypothetical protein